jgi:hypothetical protein
MPKAVHDALCKQAKKLGLKGERYKRYVYGAMIKLGFKPKRKKK